LSWTYDGFGNRLAQNVTKGTAPVVSLSISAATNRITTGGFAYDAAGNLVQWPGGTVTIGAEYDVDGRLSVVRWDGVERERYYYDARNLRVKRGFYYQVYGLGGELLGEYQASAGSVVPRLWRERVYFAGRLVGTINNYGLEASNTDRLGSVRVARRYPFGEGNNADNNEFATYRKDTTAQHEYAWHRFYSATWGRFSSPDPYVLSGGLTNPQGWNRYSYVANDPVNFNDPSGLVPCGSSFSSVSGGWSTTVYDCVSWWSRLSYVLGGRGEVGKLGDPGLQDDGDLKPFADPCADMLWCAMFPGDVSLGGQALEGLQTFLDVMGLVPGAGEYADAANVLIYAIRGDLANAGVSLAALLPIGGQAATSARLFRKGVLGHLGVDAAEATGKHAHHVFPKQFTDRFARLGLDVNDPRFGVLLDGQVHSQLHNVYRYNDEWRLWFGRITNPTAGDALQFARDLAAKYGFQFNP
jgi:RHS repeat-associated protein